MVKIHKVRLYLTMYDNSKVAGPGHSMQIHWALMLGPKHEDPTTSQRTNDIYHVTNTRSGRWEFERRSVECVRTPSMLGRILLGKVDQYDVCDLDRVLKEIPVPAEDPRWDCWKWVETAIAELLRLELVRVKTKGGIDPTHLQAYGQQLANEIVSEGLNSGHGIPLTVKYSGPGSIPKKILQGVKRAYH